MDVLDVFRRGRIVPVLVIDDPARAVPTGRALAAGGMRCAEITFRTARAAAALRAMAEEVSDLVVGAGTVLTPEKADEARRAGAKFIVAPGFNASVARYCSEHSLPYFPGIATPTELEAALANDLTVVKLFPAEPLGGVGYLKAIAAPYGNAVRFMPTGGVGPANVGSYLALAQVIACGGSWMAPADWVASGEYARIQAESQKATALVLSLAGAGGAAA